MTNIGELIEIKSVGSTLQLNCVGDFANQETSLCETNNGLQFSQTSPAETPIQGVYSLKYLLQVSLIRQIMEYLMTPLKV